MAGPEFRHKARAETTGFGNVPVQRVMPVKYMPGGQVSCPAEQVCVLSTGI